MQEQSFKMQKSQNCESTELETDIMAATGGGWFKIFNIQNKKFRTVTCTKCQYTELYREETSKLGNILDMVSG